MRVVTGAMRRAVEDEKKSEDTRKIGDGWVGHCLGAQIAGAQSVRACMHAYCMHAWCARGPAALLCDASGGSARAQRKACIQLAHQPTKMRKTHLNARHTPRAFLMKEHNRNYAPPQVCATRGGDAARGDGMRERECGCAE
jgi:hypothetical protein